MGRGRIWRHTRFWLTATVMLGVAVAGCGAGSTSSGSGATGGSSTAGGSSPSGGSAAAASSGSAGPSGSTALAQAVAYARCIRSHGVADFPDPVQTPSGGYGYRTAGIDPTSTAFQAALAACKGLPSPWNSTGQQLSSAQQQAWLRWAQCIRSHGQPAFPDPTFSGLEVHDSGLTSESPQLQQAMGACKSKTPSVGGLGG